MVRAVDVVSETSGASAASQWSIGIDFGTAFSKAAATRLFSNGSAILREVRALRIGDSGGWGRSFLVPSAMFLDRKRVHFGPQAVQRLLSANLEERELVRSFKTILGANDFEDALSLYPRATVDPDRVFRLRDLIVLYLAYLLALVDAAADSAFDSAAVLNSARVRFTRPGWIPDRIAAAHEAMASMFNQARALHQALGTALLAPEGIEYSIARGALDATRDGSTSAGLDGGIYEASAVGLCHYSDPAVPNALLIVDIGAGTTDVAGLVRAPFGGEIRVIRTGRRTIDVAGDHFDAALADLLVTKARLKTNADKTALWRTILPVVRDLKEELFSKGSVEVSFRNQKIGCVVRELNRWPPFKAAVSDIVVLYELCLGELLQASRQERVRDLGVVLAGGGSHVPAVREAIVRKRRTKVPVRIVHLPSVPPWVLELSSAHEFEALFSQLGAAFGAAISMREPGSAQGEAGASRTRVMSS